MKVKQCSRCLETKPTLEFPRRYDDYASICKVCKRKWIRKYRQDNPERARRIARRNTLKARYGITVEIYEQLLKTQDNGCAICYATKPDSRVYHFSVDHCHATGVVRGLLCTKCNRGLGLFNDDVDRMERAVEYLKGTDK